MYKRRRTNIKSQAVSPSMEGSGVKKVSDVTNMVESSVRKSTCNTSYFNEMISECGAVPLSGDYSYLLSDHQTIFILKLNNLLKECENKAKFFESLEEEIKDVNTFKKMLVHTQTSDNCESVTSPVQDPLMRLLLNVDCLQNDVINLLLGKLANIILDSELENEYNYFVTSIIRQLRFLNRIKDSSVAQKLFEIIEVSPVHIQREIIFSLPEVISPDEHEEAAKHLLEALKSNSSLTQVIIDSLANFSLTSELRSYIRRKILNRLEKYPIEYLPTLVEFITSHCDTEEVHEIVNSLRKELPFTEYHYQIRSENNSKKGTEEDSYIKLIFENMKLAVMASKPMTDAWIKVLANINNVTDFRCVDFVMLVIIYGNVSGRKSQILSLFRNKIKNFIITESLIKQSYKILGVILSEYCSTLLQIASIFFKSYNPAVSDVATVLYESSFINFNTYLRQNVVGEVLLHVGTGTTVCIDEALRILLRWAETHRSILAEYTWSVMSLLVKLSDLEPLQVRQLVDVIATLVFSMRDDVSGYHDELQMFIRKQISSSRVDQNKKAIVAAVTYAKHAAAEREGQDLNLDDINWLLEMAFGSNTSSDARRSFFNDELATLLRETELDKRFMQSWQEKTHKFVGDNLFITNIDLDCSYFPVFLQYGLDTDDGEKFVFPVADFVRKAFRDNISNSLLVVAPSLLRLLWCSEQNFDRILPFLSASAIMPDKSVYGGFETMDSVQQKLILDCLFLCCNYFIECINGFCTQKIGERVLIRLKQLIELRKLIGRFVHKVPEYTPPTCQYYTQVQKISVKKRTSSINKLNRAGSKRKLNEDVCKNSDDIEMPCTSASITEGYISQLPPSVSVDEGNLHRYRSFFRDIHCHTFKLLRMDLKLNPTKVYRKTKLSDAMINEEAWYYRATEKPELDSADLLFLLENFIFKSGQILKDNKLEILHKGKFRDSVAEHVTVEVFLTGSIKIFPKICHKMQVLSSYCKDLIEANNGVHDAPGMFVSHSSDIKLAFDAALELVAQLISWHGFRTSKFQSFLKDVLSVIGKRTESTEDASVSVLANQVGKYLAGFANHVLLISSGLSIVKGIRSCIEYCPDNAASQKRCLAEVCYEFLIRPWYTVTGAPERGSTYNQHVNILLRTYMYAVDNKLETVKNAVRLAFEECSCLTGKDSALKTFRTINKMNFPLLYRSLCEGLVIGASEDLSRFVEDRESALATWGDIMRTLLMLVEIVKLHSSRVNLAALLKWSKEVIRLFLNKGMPVMEEALRVKSTDVLALLKSLQAVTRFLHSICCHAKLTKDATVAAHVPAIRSLCERITLGVKGMLILNKIPLECIAIATLKNKDLKGNDIASQDTTEDELEGESELQQDEEEEFEEEEEEEEDEEKGSGEESESNGAGECRDSDDSGDESMV